MISITAYARLALLPVALFVWRYEGIDLQISHHADHPFRRMPITDYGGSRSPISVSIARFGVDHL